MLLPTAQILKHFSCALGVDDFMSRVEVALASYGFTGDNTIGKGSCLPIFLQCILLG